MIHSTTSSRLLAIVLLLHGALWASACSNNTSCDECLEEDCVWVPVQGCIESCDIIADTACYDIDVFENSTAEEICMLVEETEIDSQLCRSQSACDACVDTVLSDGNSTCQWFAEGEFCASACGMFGCGTTTCSAIGNGNDTLPVDCEDYLSCDECLVQQCSWTSVEGCLESCDIIADASCYTATSMDSSVEETCKMAADNEMDGKLCSEQLDCTSCVETSLSDGNTTCQWFEDGSYCASRCDMNGCGDTVCTDALTAIPSPSRDTATTASPSPSPSSSAEAHSLVVLKAILSATALWLIS